MSLLKPYFDFASLTMHKRRLREDTRDCEARFSAGGAPLGLHQISSAPPAVASYLVRVETMIFSRSGSAYAGTECAPELNGLVELALFVKGGAHPTPVIDRFWFMSVYLREPGGVLFELATDGAGFGVDESPARLGGSLVLAPWLEPNRAAIEARLPKLGRTVGGFNDFAGGAMAEMDFQIHFETEQNKAQWDLCDAA